MIASASRLIVLAMLPAFAVEPPPLEVPERAPQGSTIRISTTDRRFEKGTISWNEQQIPFYPQTDKSLSALVPVPAILAPGPYTLVVQDVSGALRQEFTVEVTDAEFPIQNIRVSKRTKALRASPGEMRAVNRLKRTLSSRRLWKEPFMSPAPDCMNSVFGVTRYHNGEPTGSYHKGVDLRSPARRPVVAPADGRIVLSRKFRLHGGTVGLDHGQGMTSIYIHLSRLGPKEGTLVRKGQVIGYVGATGFATGPHLHWQLYVHGVPVNPDQWVTGVPRCE